MQPQPSWKSFSLSTRSNVLKLLGERETYELVRFVSHLWALFWTWASQVSQNDCQMPLRVQSVRTHASSAWLLYSSFRTWSQRWKMPKLWRAHWASGVLRLWLRWSCNTPSIGCLHENGRLPLRTKKPQNSTNTTAKSASRSLSSEFLESFAKNSGHLGENMFWHYVATRMIYCRCTNRIKSLCMSHHVAIEMYKLSKIAMARRWGAPEGNATSPSASQGVSNESWLGVTR